MAGVGLCFPYGVTFARDYLRECRELGIRPTGVTIVHGWVRHPSGILKGASYEHAWVETEGGYVHDWQTRVRDGKPPMTKRAFYRRYKPEHMRRYTPEQALAHCIREGHAGPWGKPWYAVADRRRSRR